ncbi:hypothetical protein D3C78_1145750 [compost metagenome]
MVHAGGLLGVFGHQQVVDGHFPVRHAIQSQVIAPVGAVVRVVHPVEAVELRDVRVDGRAEAAHAVGIQARGQLAGRGVQKLGLMLDGAVGMRLEHHRDHGRLDSLGLALGNAALRRLETEA